MPLHCQAEEPDALTSLSRGRSELFTLTYSRQICLLSFQTAGSARRTTSILEVSQSLTKGKLCCFAADIIHNVTQYFSAVGANINQQSLSDPFVLLIQIKDEM